MGTKKQWTGREKLAIVLEGLKGECRISELCNEHGSRENRKLKETIGELTIELKRIENDLEMMLPRFSSTGCRIQPFYRNTSVMSLQLFPFPPTSDQTHSRKRKVAEITTEDNIQNEICIF